MRINHESDYQRILKRDYIRRYGYAEGKAKAEREIRQAGTPFVVMDFETVRKIRAWEPKEMMDVWREVRKNKKTKTIL